MSTYVYCPQKSQSALELVQALGVARIRRFDGLDFWDKNNRFELQPGDSVVCWGASLPEIEDVRILNSCTVTSNPFKDAGTLSLHGVPTPRVWARHSFVDAVQAAGRGVIGRTFIHSGGNDLLEGLAPNYWVQREKFKNEYRIHIFDGKSIRSGVKVPREGFTKIENETEWRPNAGQLHPWIRCYNGGWRIKYEGFESSADMRDLAAKAMKALGITFGAVDLAQISVDGVNTYKIVDVNRSPNIEGATVGVYVEAIKKWLEAGKKAESKPVPIPPAPAMDFNQIVEDPFRRLVEQMNREQAAARQPIAPAPGVGRRRGRVIVERAERERAFRPFPPIDEEI